MIQQNWKNVKNIDWFTFPKPFANCNTSSTQIFVGRSFAATKPKAAVSTDRSVATRKAVCCCFRRNVRNRIRPRRLRRTLPIRRTFFWSRWRGELCRTSPDFRNVFRAGSDFGCPSTLWADGQTSSEEKKNIIKKILKK